MRRAMTMGLTLTVALLAIAPPSLPAADLAPLGGFLKQHCRDCHSGPEAENGFDLDRLGDDLRQPDLMVRWVRTFDRVNQHEMPPHDAAQPSPAERAIFLRVLGESLKTASAAQAHAVLRRLNRVEYEHTLNDLLDVRESLATLLPEDGTAHGFDNVGESLDLSAVHLERYMIAAGKAIDAAVRRTEKPDVRRGTYSLADGKNAGHIGKHWHQTQNRAVVVFNNGGFPRPEIDSFRAPMEGRYDVTIRGYAYQSDEPVTAAIWHGSFNPGGQTAKAATLAFQPLQGEQQTTHEFSVWLKPNAKLSFLPQLNVDNGSLRKNGPAQYAGRGLAISEVDIEGPLFDTWPGRGHELLFGDVPWQELAPATMQQKKQKSYRPQFAFVSRDPTADAARLLQRFLPLVYRRPIVDADLAPLLALTQAELAAGANFEQSLRTAYIAALCSPDFLYLREPAGSLNDYALASRLSYAFWKTLPDEELLQLAAQGELSQPNVLLAQVKRLLRDPRSSRFVTAFTGQWLNLRDIDFTIPDNRLYPEYDDALKDAMVAETEGFFAEVLHNNRSLLDFIDSDWTMLNERLARHYGIDGVEGADMRPVALQPEHHRGGVLTHASVLKVSANGTTTSPVVRGVFVLERILGVSPPAPPPGVPGVEPDIRGATTLRKQLEQHRQIESCNNCHRVIDPPGFALENYDVMGGWRENYRSLNRDFPQPSAEQRGSTRNVQWRVGPRVDAAGETPAGRPFQNLTDYKQQLLAQPELFTRALTEKLAVYLTGRTMGFSDRTELDRISQSVARQGYGFEQLIIEIVQSGIFCGE